MLEGPSTIKETEQEKYKLIGRSQDDDGSEVTRTCVQETPGSIPSSTCCWLVLVAPEPHLYLSLH